MYRRILNYFSLIICINILSCTSISDKVLFVNTNIQSLDSRPNLFINNKGNGLLVWENKSRKISNFQISNNDFNLQNESSNSAIYINDIGNGFIVGLSPDEVSIGKPDPKLVSIYRISKFEPISNPVFTLSDYITDVKVNLDNKNNGLIVLSKGKEVNYINIVDLKLSSIKIFQKKFENSFIYTKDNSINEIRLNTNYLAMSISLNQEGNGYYIVKDSKSNLYYLDGMKNYNIVEKKMLLRRYYDINELTLDQNGDGFSIDKINNSDASLGIYTINSYSYKNLSSISNNRNMYSSLALNKDNKGFLIWYEISDTSKLLKAKLIN